MKPVFRIRPLSESVPPQEGKDKRGTLARANYNSKINAQSHQDGALALSLSEGDSQYKRLALKISIAFFWIIRG